MHRYNNFRENKRRKKYRKGFILPVILLIIISLALVFYLINNPHKAPTTVDKPISEEPAPTTEYREALLVACGDIMVHPSQLEGAKDKQTGKYDFSPSFEFIKEYISKADLAVGNFETTLAGEDRGYSGDPARFNSPDVLAQNLKDAGFDLLATANNHSLDRGVTGLMRTLDILEEAGIKTFGTFRTLQERNTPLIVDVNGIKIGFLAYTDIINGNIIPSGQEYIINYIDLDSDPQLERAQNIIETDIATARKDGADLVAVYIHWGYEYKFLPNVWQEEMAQILAEAGADLILGSHPHVIQPMKYITTEKDDGSSHRTFLVYSMGNFISNQFHWPGVIPTEEVKYGLLMQIKLEKEMVSGDARIKDVDYLITRVNRDWQHRVIPLHLLIDSTAEAYRMPKHKYDRLVPVWDSIVQRLEGFEPAFKPQKIQTP
ncbi:MAG: CapA family protein [Dethiobacteria bacterium]